MKIESRTSRFLSIAAEMRKRAYLKTGIFKSFVKNYPEVKPNPEDLVKPNLNIELLENKG